MPPQSTTLTTPQAQALKTILRLLDLPQHKLATEVGIVQTTISNLVRGKPIRTDTFERIVRYLAHEVSEQLERDPEGGKNGDLERHLSCLRNAIGAVVTSTILKPGGPVPARHPMAVPRTKPLDWIQQRRGSTTLSILTGNQQGGRSTVIGQYIDRLHREGREAIYLTGRFGGEELLQELIIAIARVAGVSQPTETSPAAIVRWITGKAPLLYTIEAVIVDDFDRMAADEQQMVIDRLEFIQQHPAVTASWNPIFLLIGRKEFRVPVANMRCVHYELEPFAIEEVRYLLECHNLKISDAHALIHAFGGAPWPTHIAIHALAEGKATSLETAIELARAAMVEMSPTKKEEE